MKKMRRLIPAIAMLLVSAVMLSTASFAWFTLNDVVRASGMQIQAQASGSLVIDDEPLTYQSAASTVDLTDGNKKLSPMTWENGWKTPALTATIDPDTGYFINPTTKENVDPTWDSLDFSDAEGADNKAEYYVEKILYIGSAGDTLTEQLVTIDLSALSAPATAAKAYTVAIYVNEYISTSDSWAPTSTTRTPDAWVRVDTMDGRNTVTLDGGEAKQNKGYTIPTIVGVGAQDGKHTGLQIVIRFYVDGNLDALVENDAGEFVLAEKDVVVGYDYTVATSFSANGAYYVAATYTTSYEKVENPVDGSIGDYFVKSGETYVKTQDTQVTEGTEYFVEVQTPATFVPAVITEGMTNFPEGATWYTRTVKQEPKPYKLVNSAAVPTNGTALELAISSADYVAPTPDDGN